MLKERRMPQQEPELDPTAVKKAVALKYDVEKNKAPKVVAKGKGHVAENIMEAARKGQVPVYQNKSLVNMLMALELDKEIPTELYTTVAEILAYVYRIDKRRQGEGQSAGTAHTPMKLL